MNQLWLPEVKEVKRVEKIKRLRKNPEPRIRKFSAIKKFELLYRPFDLRFRFRLNKWLEKVHQDKILNFYKILGRREYQRIRFYLYPQKNGVKWLTQPQVTKILKENSIHKFRSKLVTSLTKLWSQSR
ncbi:hypothetical protein A2Z22_04105 [Candidatus Woesebacteria bacterium RBG_16_34_12]|uniref:Uncharacterized protein n=1 Tax=Candidatus Woesebacteria bacterium RBG_16_34_12 TaxID=1802480 RepID=A0A1F7X8C5_9BACT|nr:MAG: hypothetical protein A2Z22_04105 [Candidatus Woesebacteria bacterium RBG_16_34_12]